MQTGHELDLKLCAEEERRYSKQTNNKSKDTEKPKHRTVTTLQCGGIVENQNKQEEKSTISGAVSSNLETLET